MFCPQCGSAMSKKTHTGLQTPFVTLNCNHCKFVIFYKNRFTNDSEQD